MNYRPGEIRSCSGCHGQAMGLMILSRWVDTNYQFYGTYYGRHHPQWINPDPRIPAYTPEDFRRKPTFEEAIHFLTPAWHQ